MPLHSGHTYDIVICIIWFGRRSVMGLTGLPPVPGDTNPSDATACTKGRLAMRHSYCSELFDDFCARIHSKRQMCLIGSHVVCSEIYPPYFVHRVLDSFCSFSESQEKTRPICGSKALDKGCLCWVNVCWTRIAKFTLSSPRAVPT